MYDDLKPKFIIEDGCIIIGKVIFHKDLAYKEESVRGGGYFKIDGKAKTILLYGSSDKFGYPSKEDIQTAATAGNVGEMFYEQRHKDLKVFYSDCSSLELAQERCIEIIK